MVRILISMQAAANAHRRSSAFGIVALVAMGLVGLIFALGTASLGFIHYLRPAAGFDVIAVVMGVWMISRVAYAAFTGGRRVLRLEIFRLLPIRRRALGRALLLVGVLDPALAFMALAFVGVVGLGAQAGPAEALVAVLGAVLTLALTSVLVTVVEAAMPPASRRRQDAGTMLVAIVISLIAVAGTLLPTVISALTAGTIPVLSVIVRALPTGWAAAAVDGVRVGDPVLAIVPLLGLVALVAALVAVWPVLLGRRLDGTIGTAGGRRARRARVPLLPQNPTGAVMAKELRMWVRDPLRLTFLMIAAIVGLGACLVPELTHGTAVLLPFVGVLTVLIAGAGGCNLYGFDGLPLRLTVMTPGSEGADVRGRQLAWLLLVGPYALCLTVVLTLISGQSWAWPWALGGVLALVGGAAGVFPLISLVAVLPLDENGGPAPAWPVKVWVTLILTALTAAPTVALLIAGVVTGSVLLQWLAVALGAVTGILFVWGLGRLARWRLVARELDMLVLLGEASSPA